jgi:hypothetical protein
MYELLSGAADGDESRFGEYRNAFAALRISRRQTYLPLVGDFIRNRLFGLPLRRQDFGPDELSKWIDIVVRSSSRADLLSGLVELYESDPQSYGFKLAMVRDHISKGKAQYVERLKALKAEGKKRHDIETWASRMVYQLQLPLTKENKRKIEEALDIAYHHDVRIRTKSKDKKFNFEKHASSWLDSNQLFYLADPNFIFVTADRKLVQEVSASSQAKRTLLFDDLLKIAKADVPAS